MLSHVPPYARGDKAGVIVLVIEWSCFLLGIISVVARFRAYSQRHQPWQFDTWACAVSLAFVLGLIICDTVAISLAGLGQEGTEVTLDSIELLIKLNISSEIIWSFANTSIKLSFLFFYLKVFGLKQYRRRFYIVAAFVVSLGIANIIQVFAICVPFAAQWDFSLEDVNGNAGVCGNIYLSIFIVAVLGLVIDLVVFLMPLPILLGLHLKQKKKMFLLALNCLGVLVTLATVMRIVFAALQLTRPDETHWNAYGKLALVLEPLLAIIAACAPTWRFVYRTSKMKGSTPSYETGVALRDNRTPRKDPTDVDISRILEEGSHLDTNKSRSEKTDTGSDEFPSWSPLAKEESRCS